MNESNYDASGSKLHESTDAVVMLTLSDWASEPRSNRFHYAIRLAEICPVIFVQPDGRGASFEFESTNHPSIVVLHVSAIYGVHQQHQIALALRERNVISPALWIYNPLFNDFIRDCYAPLKIFHATEDYFDEALRLRTPKELPESLRQVLHEVDIVIAVSEGVRRSYLENGRCQKPIALIENGCDYEFWTAETVSAPRTNVAIYQGGINWRLDFDLLCGLAQRLPDWKFEFCGKVSPGTIGWKDLIRNKNVVYLGELTTGELRTRLSLAKVGLIPFKQLPVMTRSFPLKAFEYAACGLPVVTIPIDALNRWPQLFSKATSEQGFEIAIRRLGDSCQFTPEAIAERLSSAEGQGYDGRFRDAINFIQTRTSKPKVHPQSKLNVTVLYDDASMHVGAIAEHVKSFTLFSKHQILYASVTHGGKCGISLDGFDAVIIHYSVRLSLTDHLSRSWAKAIAESNSLKILFIQDEYDSTETARRWIGQLGVHIVYTCVPSTDIELIYPKVRFPKVEFVPTLTGYAPLRPPQTQNVTTADRPVVLGYRGRVLPWWYGDLGREKFVIGEKMKLECIQRGVSHDIEVDDSFRIYGDAWYDFLSSCKATLGTESGSNVFDKDGKIRQSILDATKNDPNLNYESAHAQYVVAHEGPVQMRQISPKIFEAIATRTALVLFEGEYSNVIRPWDHYIPLKKDFSNVDEVFSCLKNDAFLTQLTERVVNDVLGSSAYSYASFISSVDKKLEDRLGQGKQRLFLSRVVASARPTPTGTIVDKKYRWADAKMHNIPRVRSGNIFLHTGVWGVPIDNGLSPAKFVRTQMTRVWQLLPVRWRRWAWERIFKRNLG